MVISNGLFLENKTFVESKAKSEELNSDFKKLTTELYVLEYNDYRFIIYEIDVVEAYYQMESWNYLIAVHPIPDDFSSMVESSSFLGPKIINITDVKLHENSITGVTSESKQPFELIPNTSKENSLVYLEFQDQIKMMSASQEYAFQNMKKWEANQRKLELRMKYWCS